VASHRPVWIAELIFPRKLAAKLLRKHGLSTSEVEQAVRFSQYRYARWHTHPIYGRRLIVRGFTADNVEVIAYLRLLNPADDVWLCLTAWRVNP
jgi:hypothetical protein